MTARGALAFVRSLGALSRLCVYFFRSRSALFVACVAPSSDAARVSRPPCSAFGRPLIAHAGPCVPSPRSAPLFDRVAWVASFLFPHRFLYGGGDVAHSRLVPARLCLCLLTGRAAFRAGGTYGVGPSIVSPCTDRRRPPSRVCGSPLRCFWPTALSVV